MISTQAEEGQAPWDPRVYFSLVFGSEGFVKYVGELQIAKMLRPPDQKAHGDEPDAHELEFLGGVVGSWPRGPGGGGSGARHGVGAERSEDRGELRVRPRLRLRVRRRRARELVRLGLVPPESPVRVEQRRA